MKILAIDTTMEACSVALWDNGNYFANFKECPRRHTQYILPLVKEILLLGNIALVNLDALAFGRGPGGFASVRIGIGIALGLALGARLPMISISSMATMALGAFRLLGSTRVLVAIDARMGEVYWAEYIQDDYGIWHGEKTETVYKPEVVNMRLKTLSGEWTIVGTGWKSLPQMAQDSSPTLIDGSKLLLVAQDMLPIACQLLATGKTIEVEHVKPVYLRNSVAQAQLYGRNLQDKW